MDKANAFFSSYNNVVKFAYERAINESEKSLDRGMALNGDKLQIYIDEGAAQWETEILRELGDLSPVQYMQTIRTLDELLDMFNMAPVICDETLPAIYTEKLKSFGRAAVDALTAIASKPDIMDVGEEAFLVPLMAVRLLGDWKAEGAVPLLMSILDMQGANYDIFAEQVKASLISIGAASIAPVMEAIGRKDINGTAAEYLLMVLAEAGKNYKSDDIFKCLKNAFRSKEDKSFGAFCLKEYGDGRAVPALRGFLEKNRDKLSREDYFEIVSAITALGGNAEGLY